MEMDRAGVGAPVGWELGQGDAEVADEIGGREVGSMRISGSHGSEEAKGEWFAVHGQAEGEGGSIGVQVEAHAGGRFGRDMGDQEVEGKRDRAEPGGGEEGFEPGEGIAMDGEEGGMPLAVGAGEAADCQLQLFRGMGESAFGLQLEEILKVGFGQVGEEDAMGEDPLGGQTDGTGPWQGTVAIEEATEEETLGHGILGGGLQEERCGPGGRRSGLGSAGMDHHRFEADAVEGETEDGVGAAFSGRGTFHGEERARRRSWWTSVPRAQP